MNQARSLDLLVELVRLLKKYGPEDFRSLSELLHDPTFAVTVADTLRVVADKVNVAPRRSAKDPPAERNGVADRIRRLDESEPEKAAHLRAILEALSLPDSLSVAAIRDYAQRAGLPALPPGSRRKVAAALVDALLGLDLPTVEQHARALSGTSQTPRHLENWSRIILDPTLRSAPKA